MRRALTLALAFASVGALGTYLVRRPTAGEPVSAGPSAELDRRASPAPLGPEEPTDLHFQVPGGGPTRITCSQARRVIAQVRSELSYEPEAVSPKELSASASDWLDPHSFWSLPEDSPTGAAMDDAAKQLIAEIEGRGPDCAAARDVGRVLAAWSRELRKSFDAGDEEQVDVAGAEARDLPVTGTSPERARELGRRARAVRAALGEKAEPFRAASRERFFPDMDENAWAEVVLASAVRAYVPLVDPHGAWAPLDEKSSVYEVDLFAAPPEKPWGKVTVTAVGFRIDDHAVAPLQDNDVVLSVNGVLTVGMPLEQVEQLGYASRQEGPAKIVAIRNGALVRLSVTESPMEQAKSNGSSQAPHLEVTKIPFGAGTVAVVAFQDVRDDLGDDIRDLITELNEEHATGLVLDLRGNGGGSTDGAINALGHFIPNAPLFPTRRRDGTIEVDHSPASLPAWEGPVATLVDGSTASAAEMISGALMAYGRGPSVGAPTFGKGCAQEYLDDEASVGVLRLTTLLYALPDGSPVQRVGLSPTIPLPFIAKMDDPHEREAKLPHTAPTWRGPDKRAGVAFAKKDHWSWPQTTGKIGPCEDADVCHALRALGARRPQIAKARPEPR